MDAALDTLKVEDALYKVDPFSRAHHRQIRHQVVNKVVHDLVVDRLAPMRFYHMVRGLLGGTEIQQLRPVFDVETTLKHMVITHRRLSLPSSAPGSSEQVRLEADESGGR